MPRLYIISGCNGAGKTTASYSLLPEMLDCKEFVNSDEFAKGLSPFDPSKASIQASRLMLMKIRYLLKRHEDFAVETTLATRTLLKIVKSAQAAGYTVTLLYFFKLYAPISERWILADNSQIPFRVIAEGSKDEVINIRDEETYNVILAIAEERQKAEEDE